MVVINNGYKMKRTYITNEEYYEAEIRIYNNLPEVVDEDVAEVSYVPTFNEEVAKELLLPEEEYYIVPGQPNYIITSFARCINTRKGTQIKPVLTGKKFIFYIGSQPPFFSDVLFKELGWDGDLNKLCKRYVENKWRWRAVDNVKKNHSYLLR